MHSQMECDGNLFIVVSEAYLDSNVSSALLILNHCMAAWFRFHDKPRKITKLWTMPFPMLICLSLGSGSLQFHMQTGQIQSTAVHSDIQVISHIPTMA